MTHSTSISDPERHAGEPLINGSPDPKSNPIIARKRILILGMWALALTAYVVVASNARLPLKVHEGNSFTVPVDDRLIVRNLPGSDSVDIFSDKRTLALVFVSATCDVCRTRGDEILTILRYLPGELHGVVSIDRPDSLNRVPATINAPATMQFYPTDYAGVERAGLAYVPTFVVVRGGKILISWSGIPGKANLLWIRARTSAGVL